MRTREGFIRTDGEVIVRGSDYGPRKALVVHAKSGPYMILKWKGHMGWSGRGQQSYHPTSFLIWRIIWLAERPQNEKDTRNFKCEEVAEFPAKSQGENALPYGAIHE